MDSNVHTYMRPNLQKLDMIVQCKIPSIKHYKTKDFI